MGPQSYEFIVRLSIPDETPTLVAVTNPKQIVAKIFPGVHTSLTPFDLRRLNV
jgi:hypothetical protein